jgi:hypothetical protein
MVNDLKFTGCVDSIDMIPRPWLPTDAYNSTGDRLLTDREVAVLHINACNAPKTTQPIPATTPNRFERITSDTSLTIRNDLYRGNLIYQGIAGTITIRNYLRNSNELPEDNSPAAPVRPLSTSVPKISLPWPKSKPSTSGILLAMSSPSKAEICSSATFNP